MQDRKKDNHRIATKNLPPMDTSKSYSTRLAKRLRCFGLVLPILLLLLAFPASSSSAINKDGKGSFKKKMVSATITSISATAEYNYINIKWITRNQCIDGTYLIERSTDGENFEIIGLRRGVAVGRTDMEFYFVDKEPPAGPVYYRIRHFGNDNSEMLSKAVSGSK